jgi:hypothetical protein
MALDSIIRDVATGVGAGVNSSNALKVALATSPTAAGWVKLAGPSGDPAIISPTGHMMVGQDSLLISDQVDGVALNTNVWSSAATTFTITQASGLINLNAALSTAANGAAQINSIKQVAMYGAHPIAAAITAITNVGPQTNATMELGFGIASGTAAPTDGAFFRWASSGNFVGVLNYGGSETLSDPLTVPTADEAHEFLVVIDNQEVLFMIDGEVAGSVSRPAAQPFPVATARMPVFARVYNAASTPSTAPRLQIGQTIVLQNVLNLGRDWPTALAAIGRGAYQSPVTAFAQTANHANSTAPAAATLSNTAAGYTTLGGRYLFAAPAGAATDFALFGYQVPAGFQLHVTSVAISAMNTGAAVATTATVLDWSIGVNASAVSLATADGAGTWAPRRIPLGLQGFPLGAPNGPAQIGESAEEIDRQFNPPLVVDSGRFLHIILSVPVGTATASQQIRGTVTINGYFE